MLGPRRRWWWCLAVDRLVKYSAVMGCITAKDSYLEEAVKRDQSNITVYGTVGGSENNNNNYYNYNYNHNNSKQLEGMKASPGQVYKADSGTVVDVDTLANKQRMSRSYLLSEAMSYNNIDTSLNDMSTMGAPVPLHEEKDFNNLKNKKACHSRRKLSLSATLKRNNKKTKKESGKSRTKAEAGRRNK